MFEQLDQIERRIDGVTSEIYRFGSRIADLGAQLSQSPAASGWRSIRRDIARLRWRFIVVPRMTGAAVAVLNASISVGVLAMVLL